MWNTSGSYQGGRRIAFPKAARGSLITTLEEPLSRDYSTHSYPKWCTQSVTRDPCQETTRMRYATHPRQKVSLQTFQLVSPKKHVPILPQNSSCDAVRMHVAAWTIYIKQSRLENGDSSSQSRIGQVVRAIPIVWRGLYRYQYVDTPRYPWIQLDIHGYR